MTARNPATVKVRPATAAAPATASEELVRKALAQEVIEDERGRKLTVRKPGPLAQFRMIEALGDLAANQTYMQMVNPLLYLSAIDGDPVGQPMNHAEVEALIQRLDDDGLAALMTWYLVNVIGPTNTTIDAAVKAQREKVALKN